MFFNLLKGNTKMVSIKNAVSNSLYQNVGVFADSISKASGAVKLILPEILQYADKQFLSGERKATDYKDAIDSGFKNMPDTVLSTIKRAMFDKWESVNKDNLTLSLIVSNGTSYIDAKGKPSEKVITPRMAYELSGTALGLLGKASKDKSEGDRLLEASEKAWIMPIRDKAQGYVRSTLGDLKSALIKMYKAEQGVASNIAERKDLNTRLKDIVASFSKALGNAKNRGEVLDLEIEKELQAWLKACPLRK
jgi:hypothetical protein